MIRPRALPEDASSSPSTLFPTLRTSPSECSVGLALCQSWEEGGHWVLHSAEGESLSQEPGVDSCFSPNLTKVLMYRVAPHTCANLTPPSPGRWALEMETSPGDRPGGAVTLLGKGEQITPRVYPGLQGVADHSQPSPQRLTLCL